jgi:hypothetical protein
VGVTHEDSGNFGDRSSHSPPLVKPLWNNSDPNPIWKLAEIDGIRCLTMMNGMMERRSNRKWRELLGRYIFGLKIAEE